MLKGDSPFNAVPDGDAPDEVKLHSIGEYPKG